MRKPDMTTGSDIDITPRARRVVSIRALAPETSRWAIRAAKPAETVTRMTTMFVILSLDHESSLASPLCQRTLSITKATSQHETDSVVSHPLVGTRTSTCARLSD